MTQAADSAAAAPIIACGDVVPERTSASRVLLAALVIGVLALAVWVMATQSTRATDGTQLLNAWFELREIPAGYTVAEAAVLPRGDELVRLALAGRAEETPKNVVAAPKPGEKPERRDWSKLAVGVADTQPLEIVITCIPVRSARGELEALFHSGQELRGDFKSIDNGGGRRIIERGELIWGGLAPVFVHEREFEAGGTFRDVMRVNLSSATTPFVLLARWPRGFPASKKRVEELLASFVPRA